MKDDGAKFVTLARLSEHTGLPRRWLRQQADLGRIPSVDIGKDGGNVYRFNLSAVVEKLTHGSD